MTEDTQNIFLSNDGTSQAPPDPGEDRGPNWDRQTRISASPGINTEIPKKVHKRIQMQRKPSAKILNVAWTRMGGGNMTVKLS